MTPHRHRGRRAPARGGAFPDGSAARTVFLARDGAAGWAALCRLVSAAHAGAARAARPPLERPGVRHGRADRPARTGLRGRPGAGRGPPGPRRPARRPLARAVRRGAAPGGRRPRAARQRPRLPAAGRPHPRLRRRPGHPRRPDQRGPLCRPRPGPGRRRPGLRPPPGAGGPAPPGAGDSGERWLKDAAAMSRAAERIAEAAGFRRGLAHRLLAMTEETAGGVPGRPAGRHRARPGPLPRTPAGRRRAPHRRPGAALALRRRDGAARLRP